ncbi:MAG: amidohydrolase [Pirellulales bacterium]|nr:amidohydrolase [Pirellulales bacterium]
MIFDAHAHWISGTQPGGVDNLEYWLSTWELQGITHGLVMPLQALYDDACIRRENDEIAAACARSRGRMIPFCTVNPAQGEQALAEFSRCLNELGCRGLKLHPWLQGISLASRGVDELSELAGESGAPVLVHDGTPCFSLPSQAALLARRHPKTNFILGHCGLFEHWREAIDAMRHAENLWGCLCAPHLAALREIVARADIDRLLWGSDYGFGGADHIAYRRELFDALDLDADRREAIFARNPSRLFRLA